MTRARELLLDPYSRLSRILPDWARALLLGVSRHQLWEMGYRRFLGRLAEAPGSFSYQEGPLPPGTMTSRELADTEDD